MRTINSNLTWIPEHCQAGHAKSYGSLMVEIEHPAKAMNGDFCYWIGRTFAAQHSLQQMYARDSNGRY